MTAKTSSYDSDFYAWANEQAALLRGGKLDSADIEHIAEEIESLGKAEKRELINRLIVLLLHLLKWKHQPLLQGPSWRTTIRNQRLAIADHLEDNPSLRRELPEAMARAYRRAIVSAELETGLPEATFPAKYPWTVEQVLGPDFWPEA